MNHKITDAVIPDGFESARTTDVFDTDTVPAGLETSGLAAPSKLDRPQPDEVAQT